MRRAGHEFDCCATEQTLDVSFLCHILQIRDLKCLARKSDASLTFFVLCIDPYEKFRVGILNETETGFCQISFSIFQHPAYHSTPFVCSKRR